MTVISFLKIILFVSLILSQAIAAEIALTIDDAPMGDGAIYTGEARTHRFIEVLKKHQIQAAFFANSSRLEKNKGHERMLSYSKAGHFIANHTHSHLSLNKVEPEKFIQEIDRADELLKVFPTFTKWFRYPYLHEGLTTQSRDLVRTHLKKEKYQNAYVTVDNYDYLINDLVQTALKKEQKVDFDKACLMLTDLMIEGMKYYDQLALTHIGPVRHVLLMHENDIEAFCLDKLIQKIQEAKWTIISPERAFNDPLLKEEPNTLYLNQGRVAAYVHVKTGQKFISPWENVQAIKDEFDKRKIISK